MKLAVLVFVGSAEGLQSQAEALDAAGSNAAQFLALPALQTPSGRRVSLQQFQQPHILMHNKSRVLHVS